MSEQSRWMMIVGWVLSGLVGTLLLFSAAGKLFGSPPAENPLEFPSDLLLTIGCVVLVCVLLYLFPRTAVLGAVLLTGYMGGAIATHARVHDIMFIVGATVGVVVWLGVYLRDPRVRNLLPIC
jgi:hypothetical protein